MVLERELSSAPHASQALRPPGRAAEMTTNSGFVFEVRCADEDDEASLAEFFTHVTADDLRFRFLSAMQKVGHTQLALLTHVDHRRSENFLAFHPVVGCLLASAMVVIDDDHDRAEVAIAIRSDFKNRGLGSLLLELVSEWATAMGVKTLQAIESHENRSAISVERDMGFVARACPGDASLNILEKSLAGNSFAVAERLPA